MSSKRDIIITPEKCTGCRSCQLICSLTFEHRFNPLEAYIQVERTGDGEYQIYLTEDCKNCGLCVKYCAYGTLALETAS